MSGIVNAIYIVAVAGEPMIPLQEVKAVAGKGLEGDRYASATGTWSKGLPDKDLTIIDTAILERLEPEFGVSLEPGEHRRNIEVKGMNVQDLIGQEFYIGTVALLGIKVCNPCKYLVDLTGKKELLKGLINSGLRARIVTEGIICVGDTVRLKAE